MKIVIDAMGSDGAPAVEVDGAVQAVKEFGYDLVLVGDETLVGEELKKYPGHSDKIKIMHAPEKIEMREPAALSVRRKRQSSIVLGLELLKKNEADAFVSAGNTGAVVCAATLSLRLLPGVDRPGIAIAIPTLGGVSVIIDVGANIDPKPMHLLQYGIMADAYSNSSNCIAFSILMRNSCKFLVSFIVLPAVRGTFPTWRSALCILFSKGVSCLLKAS